MRTKEQINNERQAHYLELARLADELDRITKLPEQPAVEDGTVIRWHMRFRNQQEPWRNISEFGSRVYTYAAVYCGDTETWFSTGPKSPKAYTWERLMEWLLIENQLVGTLEVIG